MIANDLLCTVNANDSQKYPYTASYLHSLVQWKGRRSYLRCMATDRGTCIELFMQLLN